MRIRQVQVTGVTKTTAKDHHSSVKLATRITRDGALIATSVEKVAISETNVQKAQIRRGMIWGLMKIPHLLKHVAFV